MKSMTIKTDRPVFFERNRVFRVYTGGMLFHDFFGDKPKDGSYPEEWIASSVRALNRDSSDPHEGVSRIKDSDCYFDELLAGQKEKLLGERDSLGILVKVLDSAIRLPVQAHPDKAFSKAHFNSEFGKAEAWLVLATRENARLYFGFKDRITEAQFAAAVDHSVTDKKAMEDLLNEVPVRPGDVFFIPAKAVHAIGYGCLILEIQEPTDFTIQPEAWCGDYRLNEYEMYLGLSQDTAMQCFDFSLYGKTAEQIGRKIPKVYAKSKTVISEILIGPEDTDCFSVRRHRIAGGIFCGLNAPAVGIVTDGAGVIRCGEYEKPVKKGDYFFLPNEVNGRCSVESDGMLELVECLPPKLKK